MRTGFTVTTDEMFIFKKKTEMVWTGKEQSRWQRNAETKTCQRVVKTVECQGQRNRMKIEARGSVWLVRDPEFQEVTCSKARYLNGLEE